MQPETQSLFLLIAHRAYVDWDGQPLPLFPRFCRSRQTPLATEMVTTGAIIHGKGDWPGFK